MSVERPTRTALRRDVAIAAALVAVMSIVYAPGISAGFVGDDFMILHRLRLLTGLSDVGRFFSAEFFQYYRPLGFVAHAFDYAIAGVDARQYHFSNILLHSINTILVLLLGRQLSPHSLAGPISALLFALHSSNHEAVMWVSARFDLLATTFSLAALWWMIRRNRATLLPAFLFGLAVLSKESAVALPLAAAAWTVFRLQASRAEALRRLMPWFLALGVCAAMRSLGADLPALGGVSRLPKLLVFGALLLAVIMLADQRSTALRSRIRNARGPLALAAGMFLVAMATAAWLSSEFLGRLAAEKLAVAGFALFHLVSPIIEVSDSPFYADPSSHVYWLGGAVSIALVAGVGFALWKSWLDDDRVWFLVTLLVAALLPVSALTEGKRYLYFPSVAVSMLAGLFVAELRGRRLKIALVAVTVLLVVSVVEISAKIRDWKWAGSMTAAGAKMVDDALAPGCGSGHVVFLTSPVGIRGVYNHFYYETFELPRGCQPEIFQVLIRVLRTEATIDVRWDGPERIVLTASEHHGNFVMSEDLRQFDRKLAKHAVVTVETPLGSILAEPFGESGQRVTLTLSASLRHNPPHYFYYSAGRIHALGRIEGEPLAR